MTQRPATTTIGALVSQGESFLAAAGIEPARLEAEVLLARSMGVSRTALVLEPAQEVAPEIAAAYRADLARRAARYPLQYITGVQEFHSLAFEVDARVLIPRPETEMIVDEVIRLAEGGAASHGRGVGHRPGPRDAGVWGEALGPRASAGGEGPVVVDVGTGSGCIAVTLAVRLPDARVFASDLSEGALEVAARNAARHHVAGRIRFARGDGLRPVIDAGLAGGTDFLVSNPPYIPEKELDGLQPELAHEPRMALSPGADGLAFTALLVAGAAQVLRPGGWLLVELGAGSAEPARRLLDPLHWGPVEVRPDAQGIARLLVAQRLPTDPSWDRDALARSQSDTIAKRPERSRPRPDEPREGHREGAMSRPGERASRAGTTATALVLRVPEAEELVGPFRRLHDPSALDGMPAHITVLYPFRLLQDVSEPDLESLSGILASLGSFAFSLDRIGRFPGVLYLQAVPEEPIHRLILRVWRSFPEHPPYGGAVADPVPHLTVAQVPDEHELEAIEARLREAARGSLPIRSRAERVDLMVLEEERWMTKSSFELSGK